MKQIVMYECQHCKKVFKTPNRHICRKNPELKNCYTCANWRHQFVIPGYGDADDSCIAEEVCFSPDLGYADGAFGIMKRKGWLLNCPDYQNMGVTL
jgi:hypothetical protein